MEAAGLLDDRRFASSRAATLAQRGYGDEAIRADLERRGVEAVIAREALEALEPEAARAAAVAARFGRGAAAARRLASRGFGADAVEAVLGDLIADEQGSE